MLGWLVGAAWKSFLMNISVGAASKPFLMKISPGTWNFQGRTGAIRKVIAFEGFVGFKIHPQYEYEYDVCISTNVYQFLRKAT